MRMRIVALCALLAGCAADPKTIAGDYVAPGTYSKLSCPEIKARQIAANHRLGLASTGQSKQRDKDAAMLFVFGISGTMVGAGKDNVQEIAAARGEYEGLTAEAAARKCGG